MPSASARLDERAAIETMMSDLLGRLGGIDILVTMPWSAPRASEQFPPERWDEAWPSSVGAVPPIRLALPAMKQRGWAASSTWLRSIRPRAGADRIDYVTTKTGIVGLTARRRARDGDTGITCNALCRVRCRRRPFRPNRKRRRAWGRSIDHATGDYLATRQPSGGSSLPEGGRARSSSRERRARDITGTILADRRRLGYRMTILPGVQIYEIDGSAGSIRFEQSDEGNRNDRRAELQSTLRIEDVPTVRSMSRKKLRERSCLNTETGSASGRT